MFPATEAFSNVHKILGGALQGCRLRSRQRQSAGPLSEVGCIVFIFVRFGNDAPLLVGSHWVCGLASESGTLLCLPVSIDGGEC
jgi:hypothetical protein